MPVRKTPRIKRVECLDADIIFALPSSVSEHLLPMSPVYTPPWRGR
jgi:hypothetical protein